MQSIHLQRRFKQKIKSSPIGEAKTQMMKNPC